MKARLNFIEAGFFLPWGWNTYMEKFCLVLKGNYFFYEDFEIENVVLIGG
jgi:hypothetical protein